MHAGTPTPSYAAPHTARPGTAATAARIRRTRSTCPTAYCGSPPPHLVTRVASGGADSPVRAARSARTNATRSASSRRSGPGSPYRPTDARTTVCPPARCAHFAEEKVIALTVRPSTAGTSRPLPATEGPRPRRGGVEPGYTTVTTAMLAYSMPPSSAAAAGAAVRSIGAALLAGAATTTASASRYVGSGAGPAASRKPLPVRWMSRTGSRNRSSAPEAASTAAGSAPNPSGSVPNTGRLSAGAAPLSPAPPDTAVVPGAAAPTTEPAARTSEGSARSAAYSAGTVACRESRSARPAYTPPSSGSTSRSTNTRPSRRSTYSPTATSLASGSPGRPGSSATACAAAAPSRSRTDSGRAGTPITVPAGSGRGTLVHRETAHLGHPQLAADPVGPLHHGHPHVRCAAAQFVGSGQPGDPGSDDDDVHEAHPARRRMLTGSRPRSANVLQRTTRAARLSRMGSHG